MLYFNIPSLNLTFCNLMGLIKPFSMTLNCRKSLKIKFDEKLILTSVMPTEEV